MSHEARSFVVVDENGVPRGAFGINEKAERPVIEIIDARGNARLARFYGDFGNVACTKCKPVVPSQ
jgi:hypothetical protein